ncbi:MAG TPA: hypothetical protein VK095_05560 [Beutenbergiaceae bacterium]|nr:hypothetical protein [Beutenbergiaceae bacterium]
MPRAHQPVTVEQVITAPRLRIFELLATPSRHREIDGSAMLQPGVVYGPPRLHSGAVFTVPMRQSVIRYRSSNEVVEFTEGQALAWQTFGVVAGRKVIGGQIWRWELSDAGEHAGGAGEHAGGAGGQAGGATVVRHTYDWQQSGRPGLLRLGRYPERMGASMQESLHRLDHAVTRR